jgi:hypothetical protein
MDFETYLNETLEEGPLARALGAAAILASTVIGGPLEDVYDNAADNNKPLIAATAALINTVEGGQAATAALFKLIKRIKDEDSKEELIDYGAEISTVSPVRKGGLRSQFVVQLGQDKEEVEKLALEVLEKVKDNGREDMDKLGDIVVDSIEIDGDDWFIAYPENADLAYLLNQRIKGM